MPILLVLVSLVAGAFVGWMSVLAGIWFTMPIFLICAAIVSISLGREFRWRLAAFSLGLFAVFALEAHSVVDAVNEAQRNAPMRLKQERQQKQP